jgi:hypothetical protein
MANVKLIFSGSEISRTQESELQCYVNSNNEIYISLSNDNDEPNVICLDKSTAIRFAKTLRTEINKI